MRTLTSTPTFAVSQPTPESDVLFQATRGLWYTPTLPNGQSGKRSRVESTAMRPDPNAPGLMEPVYKRGLHLNFKLLSHSTTFSPAEGTPPRNSFNFERVFSVYTPGTTPDDPGSWNSAEINAYNSICREADLLVRDIQATNARHAGNWPEAETDRVLLACLTFLNKNNFTVPAKQDDYYPKGTTFAQSQASKVPGRQPRAVGTSPLKDALVINEPGEAPFDPDTI